METARKKFRSRPLPFSEEACRQLAEKYGIAADKLLELARELGVALPNFEMYLTVLTSEARKRNNMHNSAMR
jgi:hypothetical protein